MNSRDDALELLGGLAVAFNEGVRLGTVADIYVDRKGCCLTGVAISTRMPSGYERPSFVDFRHVRVLGRDVTIVASQRAMTTPLPEGIEATSLKRLKHLNVMTRDGSHLGNVVDVSVDVSTGKILRLSLPNGEYVAIDPRSAAIGNDLIVLPSNTKKKIRRVSREAAGAKRPDSAAALLESTVNKVLEVAKRTTEQVVVPPTGSASRARAAGPSPSRKPLARKKTSRITKRSVRTPRTKTKRTSSR